MDLVLAAGPEARIVNVSSRDHAMSDIRYDDYNWEASQVNDLSFHSTNSGFYQQGPGVYQSRTAYGHSKTGNILFSTSLAEKLKKKGTLS